MSATPLTDLTQFPSTTLRTRPANPLTRSLVVDLPIVGDPRGNLTFVEAGRHIPFAIERVYYLYDVPGGASRGGHAHKGLHQLIIAMSGSFDIVLDDGVERRIHSLNRSYKGLYVPPMVWREIDNFSSGSVCMVLASAHYDEDDYYREYEEFAVDAGNRLGWDS
ncbi:WxcM-like protein [Jatrophihabitans sp. GAS493]|nr:FdtA/QdtA family cupin domain-containing protein [Jatrophihabitans sp. GAS493]SOD71837.1 WxcM-like protein [Jatrophihabitans sp. GAS493]